MFKKESFNNQILFRSIGVRRSLQMRYFNDGNRNKLTGNHNAVNGVWLSIHGALRNILDFSYHIVTLHFVIYADQMQPVLARC